MRSKVVPFLRGETPPPELTDEALVAACGVGDRGALAALFRRHHGAIHRFCARMLGDDPDDVVQSTFLVAWEDAARFRGQSSVRAWLLGIAANRARRELRNRGNERRAVESIRARPLALAPDPREQAERRQLVARVAAGIAALPPELRETFLLCTIEGIPGPEAARILDVRPGTLWRRLHDARKRLLPLLDGDEP
ncbi:MAG TPA: RNA polymerase sigma factor [Vulgatibacter sp.]|nr:RNA polymerase sigma factor [Vulgatibacter sp.]